MDPEEVARIAEEARRWAMSPEGQAAIGAGYEQAKQMAREMEAARRKAAAEWEKVKHLPLIPPRRNWWDY